MAGIHFRPENKGSQEPLPSQNLGFPVQETYSLPDSAKMETKIDIDKAREKVKAHAIPGPLKEILEKRPDLAQKLLSMGIVLESAQAVSELPIAFKHALELFLKKYKDQQ